MISACATGAAGPLKIAYVWRQTNLQYQEDYPLLPVPCAGNPTAFDCPDVYNSDQDIDRFLSELAAVRPI